MKRKIYKSLLSFLLISIFALTPSVFISAAENPFSDVPQGHWADEYIHKLRQLNITDGIGNNEFGMGRNITRAEFTAFLVKLKQWELVKPAEGGFNDNKDSNIWYYPYIETALLNKAVDVQDGFFRPNDNITREEMAVMLVKSLGYDTLASQIDYIKSDFTDVSENSSYITLAKDLGIISGMGGGLFMPKATATREQAATMMIRMYDGLNSNIEFLNAFYAISSSSQMNVINNLNSVSFGWSRLELNDDILSLNTTSKNNNEYRLPDGYAEPFNAASNKNRMLMIAVEDKNSSEIINNPTLSGQAVQILAQAAEGIDDGDGNILRFDGVVIDFETLKGENSKNNFNDLLESLKKELLKTEKKMYVAVHPASRNEYYNGYDYKTIGELADKVILMAHDYNAKALTPEEMEQGITFTPLTPFNEIYYSLRAITDSNTGVQDKNKIMLQISFDTAQWKTIDGKVINSSPYRPDYETLQKRMTSGVNINYSERYENPYATFKNEEDGTDNTVWYEDARSVRAKIKLAKLFGINNISLWRLGNIPDFSKEIQMDVLDCIFSEMKDL